MTTRQGGTGLGLAIVKKIVEQHYGELEFSDNPAGQGTRVTLTLHPDRLRPLAGEGGEQNMGQNETVPGRIRNRQDREDNGACNYDCRRRKRHLRTRTRKRVGEGTSGTTRVDE